MVDNFNVAWIGLTYNCNNKCSWCYASSNSLNKNKSIEKNKIPSILDLLNDLEIKRTILIGGEPTIYPYLNHVLEEHQKRDLKTGMVTNGRKLSNPDFSKSIYERGIRDLTVSIEGANAREHDSATNVRGSYEESIKGIREANKAGINVSTNSVITNKNYNNLEKIVDSLKDEPINMISFNICGPSLSGNNSSEYMINPSKAAKSFEEVYYYAKERGLNTKLVTPVPLCFFEKETREEFKEKRIVNGGPCQLSHGKNFVVEHNGNIVPCTHLTEYPLFNIYENSKVISPEKFIQKYNDKKGLPYNFRKKMKRNASKKCDDENCYEPCSGGCPLLWSVFNPEKEIKGTNS